MPDRPLSVTLRPTRGHAARADATGAVERVSDAASLDELARAASSGDAEALGRLYDTLVEPIYRYIAVRIRRREDAEDVTQLVFERIVAALPRYRERGRPFAAWAFRIARNAVVDHQRRYRPTEPLGAIAEGLIDRLGVEEVALREEAIRELREAIRHLTPDQQEALALRYAAGLSADEAARVMGRQAGTVRGLTFRAIESLRRQLRRLAP